MRTNALITAFLGKYVSAKNYNAFVSQNGMEGTFQVNDAGNVLGLTGSLSSAEGATYEFKNTLYSRAAMSNAMVDSCGDSSMQSVSAPNSGDYAYKTVMFTGTDGNACGTLIPEDAIYSYSAFNKFGRIFFI